MIPPIDFNFLKNVKAITLHNFVVQAEKIENILTHLV